METEYTVYTTIVTNSVMIFSSKQPTTAIPRSALDSIYIYIYNFSLCKSKKCFPKLFIRMNIFKRRYKTGRRSRQAPKILTKSRGLDLFWALVVEH